MDLISIIKILNDKNRLRIINILNDNSLCVGEVQTILNIQQSNTSRHLNKLKSNNVIIFTKDAQKIYYTFNKEILNNFSFLKPLLFDDLKKDTTFIQDKNKLQRYLNSDLSCDDLRLVNFEFEKLNL